MPIRLLFAFLLALCLPGAAEAQSGQGRCGGTPETAIGDNGLRPGFEPICDYDAAEFQRRLLSLLRLRAGDLSVGAAERIFGLPPLITGYDNPRNARFDALMRAAPGRGGWIAQLTVQESYGPDIPERPERFRGTLRPTRIAPRIRGEIWLRVAMLGPTPAAGTPGCLPTERLTAEARVRGWRQPREQMVIHISHNMPRLPLRLRRAGLTLVTDITDHPACIVDIELSQDGNPPVRQISDEELAASSRRSALARADAMEAAMRSHAPADDDDPDALRAHAGLMRESILRMDLEQGNPRRGLEQEIAEMDIVALRTLASNLAGGQYWAIGREICEAAIGEPDPAAALARLARERRLGLAETESVRIHCLAFVEGRRFRYRPAPDAPAAE